MGYCNMFHQQSADKQLFEIVYYSWLNKGWSSGSGSTSQIVVGLTLSTENCYIVSRTSIQHTRTIWILSIYYTKMSSIVWIAEETFLKIYEDPSHYSWQVYEYLDHRFSKHWTTKIACTISQFIPTWAVLVSEPEETYFD